MLDEMTMKETYIAALANKMKENKNIVILEADLMSATGTKRIFDTWPDRSVNIGIAEANMIGVAAGLATFGKVPVCSSFAAWISRRDYDQICVSICYSGLNTKLIGLDPGIAIEKNGGTHTAFEDIPLFRALPGMTIVEPSDSIQLSQAIPQILDLPTPVYLRLYRKKAHTVHDGNYKFVLGKADVLREGGDVTIMAYGIMVYYALQAAQELGQEGISARVAEVHTIKPLDTACVLESAEKTGGIVTVDSCNYIGGLGSAVAETVVESGNLVPVKRVGIKDHFGDVGSTEYLMERFHIAPKDIAEAARDMVARKAR